MLVVRDAKLETVCGYTSTLPDNAFPEIAFAGRSNVGKSSLINMIMNRKNLARTSSEPGKTRTINYYRLDAFVKEDDAEGDLRREMPLYLVDLPGYGYARVSRSEAEKWGALIERYLNGSGQLKNVFLLVDIRRTPDEKDLQMYEWIRAAGFLPIIIATKADKLKRSQLKKQTGLIKKAFAGGEDESEDRGKDCMVIPVSSLKRTGLERIHACILSSVS